VLVTWCSCYDRCRAACRRAEAQPSWRRSACAEWYSDVCRPRAVRNSGIARLSCSVHAEPIHCSVGPSHQTRSATPSPARVVTHEHVCSSASAQTAQCYKGPAGGGRTCKMSQRSGGILSKMFLNISFRNSDYFCSTSK